MLSLPSRIVLKPIVKTDKTKLKKHSVVAVVVARPLPRDGGMTEEHGAPEAEQLPTAWTRGRRETESRQRVSGASTQNSEGFSRKLEHTGLAEKERVASVPQKKQLAGTPESPLPKEKGTEPPVHSTRS